MPVDVVSAGCSRPSYLQKTTPDMTSYWNPEEKSGSLTLVGPSKHCQAVNIKVYRTTLEHFAVLYPQKKVCRPLGVLNLRNTVVERLEAATVAVAGEINRHGFVVRQRGFDTPMCLTFIAESAKEAEAWVGAFTSSRLSPTVHHSSLAIVEEDEEV